MLGSDGLMAIYMDGKSVDLNPGDACIYLDELEHWREPFEGDWRYKHFCIMLIKMVCTI